MRVLVTGSSGFVGHWMLEHLREAGDDALTLPADLDIRDAKALARAVERLGPDAVVHLAAQASVGSSWADATTTFQVNALGTLNLLEAADALRPRPRVLLVSSAEIYGVVAAEELPIGEDHELCPASPYAASKAAAEMLGLQAWVGRGLEVVRARPFNHTGPGQRDDFVVPSLARQVARARHERATTLTTGNLEARRDITDVRDVVSAYRLLLTRGAPGCAYNVCRGTSVSIAELARRLLGLAGLDAQLALDPDKVRPVDQPDLRGDPSRLVAATGWSPQIGLDRTLADVLDYWVSRDRV
ncbi:MAG: GDP-mannose 4,6-dehydratase [Acidimicrobiales bacterium]